MSKPASRALALLVATGVMSAVLVAVPTAAHADGSGPIRVTEWQYKGPDLAETEWVEFTNLSDAAVDVTGWSFDDSSRAPGSFSISSIGVVAPGESFILTDNTEAGFRELWGIDASVKVVGGNTQGLGNGDEINLYDASNALVDRLTYGSAPRTDVVSAWVGAADVGIVPANADNAVLSTVGDAEGSWAAAGSAAVGSPGTSTLGAPYRDGGDPEPEPEPEPEFGDATLIVINEVESNGDDTDWIELYNTGTLPVDLSGYWVTDNHEFTAEGTGEDEPWELPAGTIVAPGGFFVVDQQDGAEPGFTFGLGNSDEITVWAPDRSSYIARYTYTSHAAVTYGRFPDGTGEFLDTAISTYGAPNIGSPIRINEVSSQGIPTDWVELINVSGAPVDLTGYVIRDSDDGHAITLPGGSTIDGNDGLFVVYTDDAVTWGSAAFGLGSADSARVFAPGGTLLLDSYSWSGHVNSHGRLPDGVGAFQPLSPVTPGALNGGGDPRVTLPWPGGPDVWTIDEVNAFPGDASGLDYEVGETAADDALWVVRNKLGALYRLVPDGADWVVDETWTLRYKNGTGEPDTEGMSLAGETADGGVYFATERNNSASSVSRPSVLRYDLPAGGPAGAPVTADATAEWNLAPDFPGIGANAGLEGLTFVPDQFLVDNDFIDPTTGLAYDPDSYPLHGEGLWLIAVEATKNAYVYVLNSNETFQQLAEIESGLGVTADLQFDPERGSVWLVADEADADRHAEARIVDGAFEVTAIYERPANAAVIANEGFAIAPQRACVDGMKPVYWADDANTDDHSLREGTIECTVLGSEPIELDIVDINDFHGRIDANTLKFAGTVEELRADNPDGTVFVSAGDNIGASLFASATQGDIPTLEVLNALGLAVSAVGNHEFDQGFADLTGRVADASDFPYLGANVYQAGTEDPLLPEYVVIPVGGVEVGFVGVVTEETATLVSPAGIAGLEFGDPVVAINRAAAELFDGIDEAGNDEADIVIVLVHDGAGAGTPDGSTIDQEIAAGGPFAEIVTETDPRVAAIMTGHTHKQYAWDAPVYVDGTPTGDTRPIIQTGNYGEFLGHVGLSLDPVTFEVLDYEVVNVPRTTRSDAELLAAYPQLSTVEGIVADALAYAAVIGGTPVGEVTQDITTAFSGGSYVDGVWTGGSRDDRASESALGNLVADALVDSLAAPERGGAEIGVVNPGGLRAELLYGDDGVITYAEANAVLPFVNNLWTTTLTGAQLDTLLEQQWQTNADGVTRPSRPFLALGLSSNVTYTVTTADPMATPGDNVSAIFIDGELVEPTDEIRIGTFSFLTSGGDNFRIFNESTDSRDSGLIDRDAWVDYLTDNSPLSPSFARTRGVVPAAPETIQAGEPLDFSVAGLDLTSLGAPQNAVASIAIDGDSLGSVSVTAGAADLSGVTLPAGTPSGPATIEVTASPSGTTVRVPVEVTAVMPQLPLVGTPGVGGLPRVGGVLTVDPGTWSEGTALSYDWFRVDPAEPTSYELVGSGTTGTYTVQAEDAGKRIFARAYGSLDGYQSAAANSNWYGPVQSGYLTMSGSATVSGLPRVGGELTATHGITDDGVSIAYQWLRVAPTGTTELIVEESTGHYSATAADAGHRITVRIVATKAGYQTAVQPGNWYGPISTGYLTVVGQAAVSGPPVPGGVLSVTHGITDAGVDIEYQWYRVDPADPGAAVRVASGAAANYTLQPSDVGYRIYVRAVGTKAGYTTAVQLSNWYGAIRN